jgi:RND family efflux transporter MFP subunit
MTESSPLTVSRLTAVSTVAIVLALGIAGTWGVMRHRMSSSTQGSSAGTGVSAGSPAAPSERPARGRQQSDVTIKLTKEAVERAGIVVAAVETHAMADELRLPGVVEANAYRQVSVTPLVAGRVTLVSAQLGDRVRKGQRIAQVYSPELADARTKYVAARAMLDAHDRELQRAQKLVEIGAASRQELERIHAEHAAQTAEVESARARLQLLGASPDAAAAGGKDASATIDVPAPIDGIVTERLANIGLNVDPAAKLFTIVDLSNVWVIASAYERELHRLHEGARATITTRAYPDTALDGRISYIDPQLSADTRTTKVRVEVANPRGELRLGMYADVVIAAAGETPALTVAKAAIQNVGDRQVVYVLAPGDSTTFLEREVRTGRTVEDRVEVVSGLKGGDAVVSKGSFFVRAEAERLGLRSSSERHAPAAADPSQPTAPVAQSTKIVVSEKGFEPAKVTMRAGVRAQLTFVRTTDNTCAKEVVFPSLDIRRALPLNVAVTIDLSPSKTGEIAFACGMNMLNGTVVVE